MGENFMTAMTQIEDLVEKQKQINEKAASLLYQAINDRMQNGNVTANMEKDITNALRGFSDAQKAEILTKAIIYLAMNAKGGRQRSNERKERGRERSSIFRNDLDF